MDLVDFLFKDVLPYMFALYSPRSVHSSMFSYFPLSLKLKAANIVCGLLSSCTSEHRNFRGFSITEDIGKFLFVFVLS